MKIIHQLNSFLELLFPNINIQDSTDVIKCFTDYYTFQGLTPIVKVENGFVVVEIDTAKLSSHDQDFKKVVSFCEQGKFTLAKPILQNLIKQNPTYSEFHRIMGQILSDEGQQDDAVNCLIDALRWDAKNGWALLMMGNIFAKFKNDVPTAMKYYDQALVVNPSDNITMNNIGANLMQQGNIVEAKRYFTEALKINSSYPNTHYALSMIAEIQEDLHTGFSFSIEALKCCKSNNPLYRNVISQAFEIAKKIVSQNEAKKIYTEYRHKLEFEGDKEIEIITSKDIDTAAKIEFAENYNREKHRVIYNPDFPVVAHLLMHELTHYKFVLDARKENCNQIYFSTSNQKTAFYNSIKSTIDKLEKKGIPEEGINNYVFGLFDGINTQMFNTPIDLFIESYLFSEFPTLRPYQFLSIYSLLNDGLKAVTDKLTEETSPPVIFSSSKVLNIVNAMQYRDLFGVDLINQFKATKKELDLAIELYTEFQEYSVDKQPGEEYEMINHWADDLGLKSYFTLESESGFRKVNDFDSIINRMDEDSFVEADEIDKLIDSNLFLKSQSDIGTNMAVVMYMVDALQFFRLKSDEEIKKIAFEIAMLGRQGFKPDGGKYSLQCIPNKTFSGYHILAYYYVSWALAIPEMLAQLQLPYEEEYKLALTMDQTGIK